MLNNDVLLNLAKAKKIPGLCFSNNEIAIIDLSPPCFTSDNLRMELFLMMGCKEGEMTVRLNADEVVVQKDQLLVCAPKDQLHICCVSSDFEGKAVFVSRHFWADCFHAVPLVVNDLLRRSHHPVMKFTSQEIQLFWRYGELLQTRLSLSGRPYDNEVVSYLVRSLIFELMASLNLLPENHDEKKVTQQEFLFKRFIQLLDTLEVKPRSVAWYSDRLCVTPKYLSSVCKQLSGQTAFYWIGEHVMADIRYHLKCTDLTIKEIADKLDFPNISFFGKFVRKHTGCSPLAFRQKLRCQMPQ